MAYRSILVHLDDGARVGVRLDIAQALAADYDAHLTGLYAVDEPSIPSYARAEAGRALSVAMEAQRAEATQAAKKLFSTAAKRAGGRSEWRAGQGGALGPMLLSARYADLVVVGQHEEDAKVDSGTGPDFVEELVLASGRPVVVVPYAGRFKRFGRKVLVAWNGSREAARALSDALPLLQRADGVQVVAFNPKKNGGHGDVPGADIGLFLARHGVKVQVAQQTAKGLDIGSQILSRAADIDADLIVMGCYGHSRMRQLVLGGATRTLMESMTVPVLMSH